MDVALCTINNIVYDIATFEALGEPSVSRMRRCLLCPRCLGPGYYRQPARSGQGACFGARPHAEYCDMAGPESRNCRGDGLSRDDIVNRGERIEVDFAYGAPVLHSVAEAGVDRPYGSAHRGGGLGNQGAQARQRRLSTLLRNLMLSDSFADSDQLISVETGVFKVRDFFVPFSRAEVDDLGLMRGYWGLVSDAAQSGDQPASLWLNSGGRQALSVVLDSEEVAEFIRRFGVRDLEDLAGAYVLVFGCLRVSKNQKMYIAVSDISRITVDKVL